MTNYEVLIAQAEALADGTIWDITLLANISALLYGALEKVNWAGFYLLREGELMLGPFQGKPACTRIPIGKGVCGTAVKEERIIRVEDVHEFSGHIACDADSESEIVLPIRMAGKIIGVMPSFMMDNGWDEKDLDQMIVTEDMAERRVRMMELSDGYLALPGGVGTLDEISEVMSSRKLGLVTGEIALMNYHGFYDSFLKYLDQMVQEGFYPETFRQLIHAPQNVRDLDKIFHCM